MNDRETLEARRQALVSRLAALMGWPPSNSHIFECIRKIGHGEATVISSDKLEQILERMELLARECESLRAAIAWHHACRGHDRCWIEDETLYRAAGLEPGDPHLPPREEFRRRCAEYEAGQYGDGEASSAAALDAAAPWAEMLAQAETIFRNVLETSPVLAELRARLDALQASTARAMAAERVLDVGRRLVSSTSVAERVAAERELSEVIANG